MQTIVDYIFEQLEENTLFFRGTDNELNISISASDYLDIKRLAKKMEKQQIIDAYEQGYNRAAKVIEDETQRILKDNI